MKFGQSINIREIMLKKAKTVDSSYVSLGLSVSVWESIELQVYNDVKRNVWIAIFSEGLNEARRNFGEEFPETMAIL